MPEQARLVKPIAVANSKGAWVIAGRRSLNGALKHPNRIHELGDDVI
jgi:hypothetical protein